MKRNPLNMIFILLLSLLSLSLGVSTQTNAEQYDQRYLKWKAEQEARDAKLKVAQPNHYLSKPSVQRQASTSQHNQTMGTSDKIRLNSANLTELQQLIGIGEKKAIAILEYRQQKGAFKSIAELEEVKGIGPKILEKNKAKLAL